MRTQTEIAAMLMVSLLGSTVAAAAQTGEFVATVPGEDVHRGYALQDAWQNARNRMNGDQQVAAPQQQSEPRRVEPRKVHKDR